MSEKKVRYKLSPELVDGEHWTVVDTKDQVLECVALWCDEHGDAEGESFEIEIVAMTDEEVRALPDI